LQDIQTDTNVKISECKILIIILVNKLKDPHEMIVTYLSPLQFPTYNI